MPFSHGKISMNKPALEGIIFDLGSTLIEYENIPWEFMNITGLQAGYAYLEETGMSLPDSAIFKDRYIAVREKYRMNSKATLREWLITDAVSELLQSFNLDGGRDYAQGFFNAYYQPVARQLTIFADTINVLAELKNRGIKIGLVSNTIFPESYHQTELIHFDIRKYLDFTVFSSSFGYRKPHPSIYERAVDLIGIEKKHLLFVGDRYEEDYLGPMAFGIRSALKIRAGREYPVPFPTDTAAIENLSELLPLIG
jgi:FMN phosphatase YigB (HAD superfamily)